MLDNTRTPRRFITKVVIAVKSLPRTGVRFSYVLMLLLSLLLADGLITLFTVSSGATQETNPFLQIMLSTGDFMAVKFLGSLLALILLWDLNRHHPRLALGTTWVFIAVYTLIIYWNLGAFLVAVTY